MIGRTRPGKAGTTSRGANPRNVRNDRVPGRRRRHHPAVRHRRGRLLLPPDRPAKGAARRPLGRTADRAAATGAIADLGDDARGAAAVVLRAVVAPTPRRGRPPRRRRIALVSAIRGRADRRIVVSVEAVVVRVVAGAEVGVVGEATAGVPAGIVSEIEEQRVGGGGES